MSTLEKGTLVWVTRDRLDKYLMENHVPEDTQSLTREIVNIAFDREAEAVFLFFDNSTTLKNVKLSCYLPVYKDMSIFEQGSYTYGDVDGCIYLPPLEIPDIRTFEETAKNKELLFTVKDLAVRAGYWREEYGIVALS